MEKPPRLCGRRLSQVCGGGQSKYNFRVLHSLQSTFMGIISLEVLKKISEVRLKGDILTYIFQFLKIIFTLSG